MTAIPAAAIEAAAREIATGMTLRQPADDLARAALQAAIPHLAPARRPRMTCPVCGRDVVQRDDGKPIVHYAKNNNPHFTCKGTMFSHCRGGCRCSKHR